jgi:peptidoglycan/xylan/chitin deacetylase (PgdA/CDA1 family)
VVSSQNGRTILPFDPDEIVDNLRLEKYAKAANGVISYISDSQSFSRRLYYAIRPLLPVRFRSILQRIALQNWEEIPFPAWPVDTTFEQFIACLWRLLLEVSGQHEIPFIWFWPSGFESCAIMTHDVETGAGQEFCPRILELEQEYGINSAFEFVPEVRYKISEEVFHAIRQAGGEVCVHGLNHDGRLFSSEVEFRRRAKLIDEYAAKWGATGFRSPVMYRNPAWYDAYEFSYDMSLPNVGHLDPQRGGCCTIFPFFIGNIVELPLTTVQDYSLYHIIGSDPMEMWAKQMDTVVAKNGLVSFIIHPDYTIEQSKQDLYRTLLHLISRYGEERKTWLTLPGEVDRWWRERNAMTLTQENGSWVIRGKNSDRACIAYARLENGNLAYMLPDGTAEMAGKLCR